MNSFSMQFYTPLRLLDPLLMPFISDGDIESDVNDVVFVKNDALATLFNTPNVMRELEHKREIRRDLVALGRKAEWGE